MCVNGDADCDGGNKYWGTHARGGRMHFLVGKATGNMALDQQARYTRSQHEPHPSQGFHRRAETVWEPRMYGRKGERILHC